MVNLVLFFNWALIRRQYIISVFFLFIYLFFPTINSVNDAYSYAADIKWGEEIFHPHHLLYNALGYVFYSIISWLGIHVEVNSFMKMVNALFWALNLFLLARILNLVKIPENKKLLLVAFAGSCFAVMRFSTENETYIIPIFFSLLNSFYFLKYLSERKNPELVKSGLFGAIACLFHQIHFFWWFGILIGVFYLYKFNFHKLFLYVLPAFLVPLSYTLVVCFYEGSFSLDSLIQFTFREFYRGNVDQTIGINNILLTIISFVRTFIQVHGNMYLFIINNYLFIIPGIVSVILFIYSLSTINYSRIFISQKVIFNTHLLIFLLQLGFAFYSVGNAEFMVMIPFLLAMLVACIEELREKFLLPLVIGLFTWNLAYGVLPNHYFDYSGHEQLIDKIQKNKKVLFILNEKLQIENEIFYQTGKVPLNSCSCPSTYLLQKKDTSFLKLRINNALLSDTTVVTDCIGNQESFNRAAFLKGNADKQYFSQFKLVVVDSINTSLNKKYLYRITNKLNN